MNSYTAQMLFLLFGLFCIGMGAGITIEKVACDYDYGNRGKQFVEQYNEYDPDSDWLEPSCYIDINCWEI